MTAQQKNTWKNRFNWGFDKLLLTTVGYFVVRTFITIDGLVTDVQTLKTDVMLLKSVVNLLKAGVI